MSNLNAQKTRDGAGMWTALLRRDASGIKLAMTSLLPIAHDQPATFRPPS